MIGRATFGNPWVFADAEKAIAGEEGYERPILARRVDVAVSASYVSPVQEVIGALCAAGTVDKALADPAPAAYVTAYGDSAINYSLRVWCNNADYWDVYFAVNQNVKKIFDERGIAMTYPHLNVHLDK